MSSPTKWLRNPWSYKKYYKTAITYWALQDKRPGSVAWHVPRFCEMVKIQIRKMPRSCQKPCLEIWHIGNFMFSKKNRMSRGTLPSRVATMPDTFAKNENPWNSFRNGQNPNKEQCSVRNDQNPKEKYCSGPVRISYSANLVFHSVRKKTRCKQKLALSFSLPLNFLTILFFSSKVRNSYLARHALSLSPSPYNFLPSYAFWR